MRKWGGIIFFKKQNKMSKNKIVIPTGCLPENLLITNLNLLHYPTKIKIEMFINKTIFFNVIHFLFSIIDPEQTKRNFTECWPVCNSKTTQKFKSVAHKWCDSLKKRWKNSKLCYYKTDII